MSGGFLSGGLCLGGFCPRTQHIQEDQGDINFVPVTCAIYLEIHLFIFGAKFRVCW